MNHSHYVDYQDCKYPGAGDAVLRAQQIPAGTDGPRLSSGRIRLVDLATNGPSTRFRSPMDRIGLDMTHNPSGSSPPSRPPRAYFMPEDEKSTLYVYEVKR